MSANDRDSDDDEDYIPPAQADSTSSDNEPDSKRRRPDVAPEVPQQTEEEKKEARDALWSSFQASLKQETPRIEAVTEMVKVEKRYRYAGEEVLEVVEVPADSPDAKKWPLWHALEETTETPSQSSVPAKVTTKRPGPRKSKVSLPSLPAPGQKAKKLSTLDKSVMDWQRHVIGSEPDIKDELEANRRGGGYIEKMEFLERVEARKADAVEASKGTKRRRT